MRTVRDGGAGAESASPAGAPAEAGRQPKPTTRASAQRGPAADATTRGMICPTGISGEGSAAAGGGARSSFLEGVIF